MDGRLRVHAYLPGSRANGPGRRAILWLQGCTLVCPGCFNPATHAAAAGVEWSVDEAFDAIASEVCRIEGLTVTGGEPLQQLRPVVALLRRIRAQTSLSTIVLTGYEWGEISRMPLAPSLLACIDVLIAGRYLRDRRVATGLRGSSNKTVHFLTTRYSRHDLERVPATEIEIAGDGTILVTGVDPPIMA